MSFFKVSFVLLVSLFSVVFGHGSQYGGMGGGGFGGGGGGFGGGQGMQRQGGGGFGGGGYGGNGRDFGGQYGGSDRKYRSKLYYDDDVYGYEANYPGGEAMYINYRSSDARARRGQEFARSSPYSSGGGGGGRGYSSGGNGGFGGGMGYSGRQGGQGGGQQW